MKFIKTEFTFEHKGLIIHLTVRDKKIPHRVKMSIFNPETGFSQSSSWIAPSWRVISIGGAKSIIENNLNEFKVY